MTSTPTAVTEKTWDDFFDEYTPVINTFDDNASLDGCMFETFGKELEFVSKQDPKHVWTYTDSGDAVSISQGMHYVNRIGYLVTKEPATCDITDYTDLMEDADQEDLPATNQVSIVQASSEGEAVVSAAMNIGGVPHVCVGIVGSNKIISICGVSGAADEAESLANAHRITNDWNKAV